MSMTVIPAPRHRRGAVALLGASALTGLGVFTGAAPRHASAASHAIPNGGTVIAAEAELPDSLNPYLISDLGGADVDGAVFDSMVYLNDKNQFVNDLATSYSHDAKGLHWTFNIVHNATWQDGQPLTSKDIVFTTKLVPNPKFPATQPLGFDHVKSIVATGPYQVKITLTSVYAPFLQYWGGGAILPEHILGKVAPEKIKALTSYNKTPLGSGPFKITDFKAGDHVTETANKSYFRGAPHLDKVIFRVVSSGNTAVNQIQTGEVNLLGQSSDISARQFNQLKGVAGLTPYNTPGDNWDHVDLIETGFLKDRTVRQALAYATPKQQIIKAVNLGYGIVSDGDQPPASAYYNPSIANSYPYSAAQAKRVLMNDGFTPGSNGIMQKGGKPFTMNLWVGASAPSALLTAQILKQAYGQAGVNVAIKTADAATLFGRSGPLNNPSRLTTPTMNAVIYEWVAGPEPDDSYFWASNQIPDKNRASGGNADGYINPQVDRLTTQGLQTLDHAQRVAIYRQMQTILRRDQPDVFISWGRVLTIATNKLHNYKPTPFDYVLTWNVKDWYMS